MNKLLIFIIALLVSLPAYSNPNITARTAILLDYHSDKIIYEYDSDIEINPASMTKIMTSIIVFDLLIDHYFFAIQFLVSLVLD